MKELPRTSKEKSATTFGLKPLVLYPDDILNVLNDPQMTPQAKRALLADWASDARVVADAPALRRLDNGVVVRIDVILEALARINERGDCSTDNDDDDPPPASSAALPGKEQSRCRLAA